MHYTRRSASPHDTGLLVQRINEGVNSEVGPVWEPMSMGGLWGIWREFGGGMHAQLGGRDRPLSAASAAPSLGPRHTNACAATRFAPCMRSYRYSRFAPSPPFGPLNGILSGPLTKPAGGACGVEGPILYFLVT